MRKAADLLKKLIVQIDTGNIVGKVEDLLLDPDQDRLVALITMSGRWLREAELLPWERIIVCTGDVILVQPGAEPQAASALPQFQPLLERKIHLSGTRVLTASGDKVGTVGEMLIDGEGRIKGYAISRGFLGAERQFIAAEDVEAIGADALIVRDNMTRDTLDDEPPAEELRPAIVLPLTGARIASPLAPHHEPPPASEPPASFPAYTGPTIFVERPEEQEEPAPEPALLAAPPGFFQRASAPAAPDEPAILPPPAADGEALDEDGLASPAGAPGGPASADQPIAPEPAPEAGWDPGADQPSAPASDEGADQPSAPASDEGADQPDDQPPAL